MSLRQVQFTFPSLLRANADKFVSYQRLVWADHQVSTDLPDRARRIDAILASARRHEIRLRMTVEQRVSAGKGFRGFASVS
jgi:hypothetical protein